MSICDEALNEMWCLLWCGVATLAFSSVCPINSNQGFRLLMFVFIFVFIYVSISLESEFACSSLYSKFKNMTNYLECRLFITVGGVTVQNGRG